MADISAFCSDLSLNFHDVSSPSYTQLSTPYAHRFVRHPLGILRPKSTEQLSTLISKIYTTGTQIPIWPRSGGHSYAASSTPDGKWIVDMRDMNYVKIADETVTMGAGARLGLVALALDKRGRAMPHGTCPYVGATGHTLAGGFGFWSRLHGLACDNLISITCVLYTGDILTCNSSSNSELFWAFRGAGQYIQRSDGGPLAIVTELTYKTYPKPEMVTYFSYEYDVPSSKEEGKKWLRSQLENFQAFGSSSPRNELGCQWRLKGGKVLQIHGVWHLSSTSDVGTQWQDELESSLQLRGEGWRRESTEMEWKKCLALLAGEHGDLEELGRDPDREDTKVAFYAKSLVVSEREDERLTSAKLEKAFDYTQSLETDLVWWIEANIWGGAISHPSTPTSFAHRDAVLVLQFYIHTSNNSAPLSASGVDILNTTFLRFRNNEKGVGRGFPGYIDPGYTQDEMWEAYLGEDVKKRCEKLVKEIELENKLARLSVM